jgi:multidrug resistance efflux pump
MAGMLPFPRLRLNVVWAPLYTAFTLNAAFFVCETCKLVPDLRGDFMVVCSPKDGFVVEITPEAMNGLPVPAGKHLLTLDTDDELRSQARITKMESVRRLMAEQYQGAELETSRRLAIITVEVSAELARHKQAVLSERQMQHKIGVVNSTSLSDAEAQYNQARLDLEKSELALKQFDFATLRHKNVNELVETYMQQEHHHIETKINRLKVLSPIRGTVSLRVAVNSFAELGSVLLEIEEVK